MKNALRPPTTARLRVALASLLGALLALALPAIAQALPDGYAYEKVSAADKGNGEVAGGATLTTGIKAAESGDRILYAVDGAPEDATSFAQANVIFSERGSDAWSSAALTGIVPFTPDPSAGMGANAVNPFPQSVSRDGSKTVVETNRDPATGAPIPIRVYLVDLPSRTYERISPVPVSGEPNVKLEKTFSVGVGGTDDFSTLFFASRAALTPDADSPDISDNEPRLYMHTDAGTTLASYLPGGTPWQGILVSADPGETDMSPNNGVSADGSVFWWQDPGSRYDSPYGAQLFRAQVGVKDSTMINASENTTETVPGGPASFEGASADAERAVFTSDQPLTDGASTGSSVNQNLFLYKNSADPDNDQNLTLISADSEPADGTSSLISKVLGVSDDAQTVYFTAASQLVAGEPTDPGSKLYRWTQTGGLEYLLTGTVAAYPPAVTPDGRYLAFRSSASGITPEDNGGKEQVYLYDSDDGSIVCASCMADGANSSAVDKQPSYNIAGINAQARRMLSDDGRVIFVTADRLLREDTNGKKDVYTYKDGQVDLVSTGRATSDARFADATSDGSRIYFVTREQLSGWDEDTKADMYVARIGDGLPEPDIRPESPCTGDDCQGPSPEGPSDEIGTGNYEGPGNGGASSCVDARQDASKAQRKAKQAHRAHRAVKQRAKRLHRKAGKASGKRAKRLERRADRQDRNAQRLKRKQRRLKRAVNARRRELRACRGQDR